MKLAERKKRINFASKKSNANMLMVFPERVCQDLDTNVASNISKSLDKAWYAGIFTS